MDFISVLVFHRNGGVIVIITTGISSAGYFLGTNPLHLTFSVASRSTCYRKQLSSASWGGKEIFTSSSHLWLVWCMTKEHSRSTHVASSNDFESDGKMKHTHTSHGPACELCQGFSKCNLQSHRVASWRDWLEKVRFSALIVEQLNQKPQGGAQQSEFWQDI